MSALRGEPVATASRPTGMRTAPAPFAAPAPPRSPSGGRGVAIAVAVVLAAVLLQLLVVVGAAAAFSGEMPWQEPDMPCGCSIEPMPGPVT